MTTPLSRLFGFLALGWVLIGSVTGEGRHKVLVLQSYNQGYFWTRSIGEGLEKSLDAKEWDLWFEYMDTKNLTPGYSLSLFDPLYEARYQNQHFDLLITVDDPAYEYFASRRETLFHGVAAVCVGMNAPPLQRLSGVSYIIENPDYAKTLNLALQQFPGETVHVIVDRSVTGRLVRTKLESLRLDRPVRFEWLDEGNAENLAERVRHIPWGDILVFAVFFNPGEGYQSNDRLLQAVREASQVPIYGFWTFCLPPGAFGGYLYDGKVMGEAMADLARRQIQGEPVVYRDQPQGTWIFDWPQTREFGLDERSFPPGTSFLRRPVDFWSINQTAVVVFLIVFGVLIGFTVLILFHLRTQRTLLSYGEKMIATQRELMHNLGNVIENRSDETATHVQRITSLSLLLADWAGLSREQRLQLEVCAPMHDIGKVGIPDAILKKPGLLTTEEHEVMKTHTRIGYSIFRSSPNPLIQAAARIALEHHERWDGHGYPDGKAGQDIDLLARVVAVVDVFDALLSDRVYKKAWEPERVREFLSVEAGAMFDPRLVEIFLDHWQEFLDLRAQTEQHEQSKTKDQGDPQ